jgi:hypothetical protein
MVGIYRKVKQLLNLVQDITPYLNKFTPGLGPLIHAGASFGESVADGINNVYEDYQAAKKSGTSYGIGDGIKSFARPTAVTKLTKSYGGLHPRLKLKSRSESYSPSRTDESNDI